MIDFARRLVLVHIPRTGGSSIERGFSCKRPHYCTGIDEHEMVHLFGRLKARHFRADQLEFVLSGLGEFEWYAFVRNPWDWVVSLFHHTTRTSKMSSECTMKKFLDGFYDYYTTHEYARTQRGYLAGREHVQVLKFENRVGVLREWEERWGLRLLECHCEPTKRNPDYRVYYDDETAMMVESMFEEDVAFGYSFDDGPPEWRKK